MDAEYLKECVRIESFTIEEEFIRLPGDLAYWNNKYADVYQYWLERKQVTAEVTARRSSEIREDMTAAKGKRPLVSEVDDALTMDPAAQQAKMKEIAAEAEKVRLYGIMDALRSKREMLISLGAHMRAEMKFDPLIRERAYLDGEKARQDI